MSELQFFDVLIVGGGHGGAQAAIALRGAGFEGSVAIVSRESELPYERPPLTKEYLAQEREFERLRIRPADYWLERNVEFLLGKAVTQVEPDEHRVRCGDGTIVGYGKLIWAAGGDPRALPLPGAEQKGVHAVRDREDVDRIMSELPRTKKVVVIGGGYIGLEAAAVLSKLGKSVCLLEELPRVLARVAGEDLSAFYESAHRAHGVDLRVCQQVQALIGEGRVTGVRLVDGDVIPADMVIVGIGIVPCVEPLLAAGADGNNGVLVDEQCRTSLADIYAVGDCAAHTNAFAGGKVIRLESVQNANDMASTAASAICGNSEARYCATPWFWSNQFDLKLQTVGLSSDYITAVLRGDPASRKFSVVYLNGEGKVLALDCVNNPRDYSPGRRLVETGAICDPAEIADASRHLKEWLAKPAIQL